MNNSSSQFQNQVNEIVALLPGASVVEVSSNSASVRLSSGGVFGIVLSSADQLTVRANWPKSELPQNRHNYNTLVYPKVLYSDKVPSDAGATIFISASKKPEVIAREIQRRFISSFEPAYAACAAKRDFNDKWEVDRENLALFIAVKSRRSRPSHSPFDFSGPLGSTIRVASPESVRFEVTVDPEQAARLIDFLRVEESLTKAESATSDGARGA